MRKVLVALPFVVVSLAHCAGPESHADASIGDVGRDTLTTDAPGLDATASDATDIAPSMDAASDTSLDDASSIRDAADVPDTTVPDDGGDGFVLGTTVPDDTNTGVLPGVPRTDYTGPTTITVGNQTFRNLDFNSIITLAAPNVTFENCMFRGGATAPTSNTAMVDVRSAAVSNARFFRCTFSPRDPSVWTNGLIGHDFTAERCLVEHCVDGFGVYNQHAESVDVHILGNLVREMSWYSDDPNHTDGSGTHNDCVQQHSGRGLWIIGNAFHAYRWSEGGLETPATPQSSQIVLTQHTAFFMVSDIHVNQNFIWGGDNGIKFYSARAASLGGGHSAYLVECVNNTWMDDNQTDYGGVVRFYPLRIDSNITLNGRTYPTTGGTDDASGNHYASGADVNPVRQGRPVKVRCDAVPVN